MSEWLQITVLVLASISALIALGILVKAAILMHKEEKEFKKRLEEHEIFRKETKERMEQMKAEREKFKRKNHRMGGK